MNRDTANHVIQHIITKHQDPLIDHQLIFNISYHKI